MKRSIEPARVAGAMRWLAVTAIALNVSAGHAALVEGKTNDGGRYVVGGIGTEEVDALRQEAPAFSLQLITAARTGAYLAGTHVRIVGPGANVVLDTTIEAPWLLVDLPGGRYTVRATYAGATVERRMTIAPGKPQRVVLHFNAAVDAEGPTAAPDTARRMPP